MSKIEDLIKQYCPNGVECRKLVDITNILYGYPFNSKLFTEDDRYIPLIRIRDIKEGRSTTYYKGEILKNYIIKKGDILVGMDGEFNLGKWNSKDALLNQRTLKISTQNCSIVLNGYLFHILKPLFKNIEKSINGSTVKHLSDKAIKRIKIPVPPMTVQEEIVKILDSYSELEAELESKLEAEIDARKKQYEYHLNQLLSFDKNDKDIKFMPLCEACTVKRGIRLIKNDLDSNSQYAVYQNSLKPLGYYNQFNYEGDTTFVISAGAAGDIGYSSVPFWAADDCLCVRATEILNNKYIYYVLKTKQNLLYSKVRKGAVPRLSRKVVEQIIIPIPPLMEQERIVSILDEFNKLTNEISDSLQAEIIARKKQYEYYRNKLLTFKEAV